jgi:Rho-binding antiterminator
MSDKDKQYHPIPCAIYSEYELAIMRHHWLQLVWQEPGGLEHISRLLPLDLKTEDHAEYLLAKDYRGEPLRIRLDYIRQYRILD